MIESIVRPIDPERDLPTLDERVLRLPEWRRRKALSFAFPLDRLQCALAYELLAETLLRNFGLCDFTLEYDSFGKPSVKSRDDIFVSIAHCRKGVMVAVADTPVGCDIEEIRRPYAGNGAMIADHCFSEKERRMILSAPDPAVEFTRIWTVKEAVFKLDNSLGIEHIDTTNLQGRLITSEVSSEFAATVASPNQDIQHHKIRLLPI